MISCSFLSCCFLRFQNEWYGPQKPLKLPLHPAPRTPSPKTCLNEGKWRADRLAGKGTIKSVHGLRSVRPSDCRERSLVEELETDAASGHTAKDITASIRAPEEKGVAERADDLPCRKDQRYYSRRRDGGMMCSSGQALTRPAAAAETSKNATIRQGDNGSTV